MVKMTNLDLVPATLNYGRENTNTSSLVSLIVVVSFILIIFFMSKAHFRMSDNTKYQNGKKQLLRFMPILIIFTFTVFTVLYFIKYGITTNDSSWQSDYFVIFTVNFITMVIFFFYYIATNTVMQSITKKTKIPVKRRKITQKIINGTFKATFFFFWALVLTPYYVLAVGHKGIIFLLETYAVISVCIAIFLFFVAYYTFGKSPFTSLVPLVILIGACVSYYDFMFGMTWGAAANQSITTVMGISALLETGFFGRFKSRSNSMRSGTSMIYGWLILIVLLLWNAVWIYYGVWPGGTDHTAFYRESFVPD